MNFRVIGQTAALVSWHGPDENTTKDSLSDQQIAEYWKSSCALFRRWRTRTRISGQTTEHAQRLIHLTEEVLVSELVTRCVGACLLVRGERDRKQTVFQIARQTLAEHQALKQVLMDRLESDPGVVSSALRCQRLARKLDRWADLLMSPYATFEAVLEVAPDAARCLDFGDEWHTGKDARSRDVAFQIHLSALSRTIPNQVVMDPLSALLHQSRNEFGYSLSIASCAVVPAPKQSFWHQILHRSPLDSPSWS